MPILTNIFSNGLKPPTRKPTGGWWYLLDGLYPLSDGLPGVVEHRDSLCNLHKEIHTSVGLKVRSHGIQPKKSILHYCTYFLLWEIFRVFFCLFLLFLVFGLEWIDHVMSWINWMNQMIRCFSLGFPPLICFPPVENPTVTSPHIWGLDESEVGWWLNKNSGLGTHWHE